ncbi:hypothetical protein ACEQ8H_005335 [Pleosporales sp. CAS-2024a]
MSSSPAVPPSKSTSKPTSPTPPELFPPDEEASLLAESHALKSLGNQAFTTSAYYSAIQQYEKALATCPAYLDYDMAVLHANISACHMKLSEWAPAVERATRALDALDRLEAPTTAPDASDAQAKETTETEMEMRLAALQRSGHSLMDAHKLRTKALLRRAKSSHARGGWAHLQSALQDYQALARPPHELSSLDMRAVLAALRTLPDELDEAKNREMSEMMGKLKQLGNGILKPFGLSTDNFAFTKDERSGGYSMNFQQNQGNK